MIRFAEAIDLLHSAASPLGTENIALGDADGRVLAKPVVARIDSPRRDVSAMDGYAVREADLDSLPIRLQVVGKSFAGEPSKENLFAGTCIRIFTGAPIPAGADRVIIQEEVTVDGAMALIDRPPGSSLHIRKRGSDFSSGAELLSLGRLLDPRAIVAAAGADFANVDVFRQPRLKILSTGDELTAPGTAADDPRAIPESVSFGVASLARQWGAICDPPIRLRDELGAMSEAAEGALNRADVIVVTGGASVGEKDFAKAAFQPLGLETIFSKVAIKPGKPVWAGRIGEHWIVGLPGNPTSALVTARLLLCPLLAAIGGRSVRDALRWTALPIGSGLPSSGPRETFHRAKRRQQEAQILAFQDSGAQKTLADADLLVCQPANSPELKPGEIVQTLDF